MSKKKERIGISNPDELNKHLQYTSVTTWVVLGAVVISLVGLFTWSFIYKIAVEKITGEAVVSSGAVTLTIEESQKSRLAVGQKVYIANKVGKILSIEDGEPIVSLFELADNNYTYTIVIKEMRPIDFLIK